MDNGQWTMYMEKRGKFDFLFEIGTEEIPAGYIDNAVDKLKESFVKDLLEYKLKYTEIFMYSTPRRLAIKIIGLEAYQNDETIDKTGPAKRVAFDDTGKLTKAGEGFLKGADANETDIYILETNKGEYIAVKIFVKGQDTKVLLPQMMKNALNKVAFPKTMKWGSGGFMFARPIRWLLALCDEDIIDFEFEGVKAGRISFGNRFQGLENQITVSSVTEYPDVLKRIKVIADREERKNIIVKQASILSPNSNVESINASLLQTPNLDEKLLDTVTDLVEFPTAVMASFSKEYLDLSPKIITSTLSQNQKYFTLKVGNALVHSDTVAEISDFPINDNTYKEGNLSNEFIFISNGDPEYSDIIRKGNEKVVNARLNDAKFYFQEDTKRPLEEYVAKLSDVVFQSQLGTMLEKTHRVVALCEYIFDVTQRGGQPKCVPTKFQATSSADCQRAALLSKADLVTLMLGEKEFTALQGYIGMNYALLSGEKPEVAKAIYEHYMPRGQKDDLPSEICGAVLAIADKLDTVCGIIGVGLMPTGSADPFAIRRAANGIVQIIDKYELEISLSALVEKAFECLHDKVNNEDFNKNKRATIFYLKQRIKWLLDEIYKINYDVIDALDIFEWDDVNAIKNRAMALQKMKSVAEISDFPISTSITPIVPKDNTRSDFEILVSGFKRVSNILEKNKIETDFKAEVLKEEAEKKLFIHLQKIQSEISPLLENMAYKEVLEKIVPLGNDIDDFFDKVLVMCDDIDLRNNRLALLNKIREIFLNVADISKINLEFSPICKGG